MSRGPTAARLSPGLLLTATVLAASPCFAAPENAARGGEGKVRLIAARKIWDAAPHNAFTDIVRFDGALFCVFREGAGHVSPDGAIRVITSRDGEAWTSAARIESKLGDLRDPKVTIAPDGRLHLLAAAALPPGGKASHQTYAWLSKDGRSWGEGRPIGEPDVWLWRIAWRDGVAYGLGYGTKEKRVLRLYRSTDGLAFEKVADDVFPRGEPNESSLVFDKDETCRCLLRRDDPGGAGQLGTALPPYTTWSWEDLGARIGGPHMARLEDGRLAAVVRLHEPSARTALCWIEGGPEPGKQALREALALPSGGDTSYAGMVLDGRILWISYYSSHEGKTSVYLAKVEVGG